MKKDGRFGPNERRGEVYWDVDVAPSLGPVRSGPWLSLRDEWFVAGGLVSGRPDWPVSGNDAPPLFALFALFARER